MAAKYIFRLDDICPYMNYKNFIRIRDIFIKNNIKPIIGVIPYCKDSKLKKQSQGNFIEEDKFWEEIKNLQDDNGWEIAQHGYDHVYITEDSGIFKTNKRSEFAGVTYEVQVEKIDKGKKLLESKGLIVKAFMAPAHSLDLNTINELKGNGIFVVTDGISAYPYVKNDVLFVPQISSWPKIKKNGVDTVCFHINSWTDEMFERLEHFLLNNKIDIITFSDAKNIRGTCLLNKLVYIKVKIRRVLAKIKHSILER